MKRKYSSTTQHALDQAIVDHRLPVDFSSAIDQFYWPVAEYLADQHSTGSPLIVGVQGSQGSGKTTFAAFQKLLLEHEFGLSTLVTSIDDFYLTRAERLQMSAQVHPLFKTRGVPGTHDIELLQRLFDEVRNRDNFAVPVFNKALDDRASKGDWQTITKSPDVVILEGWCVGIRSQATAALHEPVNDLERLEDRDALWRTAVNQALAGPYQDLYKQIDQLVVLQAPSFDCVHDWRQLQEQKLIERLTAGGKSTEAVLSPKDIGRFIAHYQRLTEHALASMPERADCVLHVEKDHRFSRLAFAGMH